VTKIAVVYTQGQEMQMSVFDQANFEVRFGWGELGARRFAAVSSVVVMVAVLSFTTAVEVACSRGARVYPFKII
jgi:2-phosphosulfolactate phosphatase